MWGGGVGSQGGSYHKGPANTPVGAFECTHWVRFPGGRCSRWLSTDDAETNFLLVGAQLLSLCSQVVLPTLGVPHLLEPACFTQSPAKTVKCGGCTPPIMWKMQRTATGDQCQGQVLLDRYLVDVVFAINDLILGLLQMLSLNIWFGTDIHPTNTRDFHTGCGNRHCSKQQKETAKENTIGSIGVLQ